MNVKISKQEFLNLLESVQGVIPVNSSMPQISNVFLKAEKDTLHAFGTDLEINISSSARAEVSKNGEAVVEAKKIYLFVKELSDGEITLKSKENNWLNIKQGDTKANLMGINPKDYPKIEKKKFQILVFQ